MKAKAKNYVWVLELFMDNGKWAAGSNCAITKKDGMNLLREWRFSLPDDKLRLRKYVPA